MNFKIYAVSIAICLLLLSCSQKQTGTNLQIEGFDPNTTAIVVLKLEGETLPGTPKVVSADDTSGAFFETMGSPEYVVQVDGKKWAAVLTKGNSYIIGWLVKDNKMFGYCSEPFVAQDNLEVTFSPGMPVTLEYDLTKPPEDVNVFPAVLLLSRKAVKNGGVALMSWMEREHINGPGVVTIKGLAQGTFQLYAQALVGQSAVDSRTRFLYDKRFIQIEAGKTNSIEAQYPRVDTTVEDGDITIRGRAHNSAGEALSNEKIKLIPYNLNEGPSFDLYYPDSVTDANGNFEFKGIRPDIYVLVKCMGSSINLQASAMTKGASLWVDFLVGVANIQLGKGYPVPEFNIIWKNSQNGKLNDLYGKIVVVDVWASWCVPCLKSMPEFNTLAQEYKNNEDVVFISLSIDSSKADWETAVDKAGWNAVRHGWYDRENPLAFNKPVPYSMIIDKQGTLCAEGNVLDIRAELKKVIEDSK
jgi:thiol-disulfide isomerase/thioredoxin